MIFNMVVISARVYKLTLFFHSRRKEIRQLFYRQTRNFAKMTWPFCSIYCYYVLFVVALIIAVEVQRTFSRIKISYTQREV